VLAQELNPSSSLHAGTAFKQYKSDDNNNNNNNNNNKVPTQELAI